MDFWKKRGTKDSLKMIRNTKKLGVAKTKSYKVINLTPRPPLLREGLDLSVHLTPVGEGAKAR